MIKAPEKCAFCRGEHPSTSCKEAGRLLADKAQAPVPETGTYIPKAEYDRVAAAYAILNEEVER